MFFKNFTYIINVRNIIHKINRSLLGNVSRFLQRSCRRALFSMFLVLVMNNIACAETVKEGAPKVIGILMPMDHMALREIVAGFQETLTQLSETPVEFKIQNAQGDMNLQCSIIQQFLSQKVDMIVPIGTTATQMTVKLAGRQQPIVSLAALHPRHASTQAGVQPQSTLKSPTEHQSKIHEKEQPLMLTGVLDEIGPKRPLELLAQVIPSLKKITLVHSGSEKIFPEIEELMLYAKNKNLIVQKLMIQSLPEIYTISRLIDQDSQAIFILKDHLVVSGIKALVREANRKNIPVVATDEGSVKEGAAFALGVKERSIGEQGARLAHQVLSGRPAHTLPLEVMNKLVVFCNEKACLEQKVSSHLIKSIAEKSGYESLFLE